MQRSDFVIKLTSFVVFLALVCYIGYSIYDSKVNPFRTTLAIRSTVSTSVETEGFCVREESLLSYGSDISLVASEGEKMSSGETVAVSYKNHIAYERSLKIKNLQFELDQIETLLDNGKNRDDLAFSSTLDLSRAVFGGDLTNLDTLTSNMSMYILTSDTENTDYLLSKSESLKSEIASLKSVSDADTDAIAAPVSGVFSSHADGFESISYEDITSVSPSEFSALFSNPGSSDSSFGKLVTGLSWYYVTILDKSSAQKLTEHKSAELNFSKTYIGNVKMTVESIGQAENDKCVVVFSSNKNLSDVLSVREMSAELIFESVSGIRVPREAVHLDEEGNSYIYKLSGIQAKIVYVSVDGESGDYYIVTADEASLHEGEEIISRAKNLYDGKVMQ